MKSGIKGWGLPRILLAASFAGYLLVLVYLMFVMHGRYWTDLTLWEYIRYNTNLVPFRTIGTYIRALSDNSMNMDTPVKNLLGNLLMFLPMGLYLPGFFKRLRTLGAFCICMVALIFAVEAAELLLRRGSFDIDDFILNMTGALAGFTVFQGIMKIRRRHAGAGSGNAE